MMTLIKWTHSHQQGPTPCHHIGEIIDAQKLTQIITVTDQRQFQTIKDLASPDKYYTVTKKTHLVIL